jgi:isoleucyl-tRNA synthetase
MRLSKEILSRNADAYRKIRNTCRFLLGNLHDFQIDRHALPLAELEEIDRWVLHQLNVLITCARDSYERYEFHLATQAIHRFSTVTLSSLYLDVLKDRLYTSPPDAPARRSAQSAMHVIVDALTHLMAPVLCFTAEEIWQVLQGRGEGDALEDSIHAAEFPRPLDLPSDEPLLARWARLLEVRDEVLKALELVRTQGDIGNSLEAHVTVEAEPALAKLLGEYSEFLQFLFIVSRTSLGKVAHPTLESTRVGGLKIGVGRAEGTKCERCWNITTDVGRTPSWPTVCARCAGAIRVIIDAREAGD